jgi:hypothetical protein
MSRKLLVAWVALGALLVCLSPAVRADENDGRPGSSAPWMRAPEGGPALREHARNAGVVVGTVLFVNRVRGIMNVASPRGRYAIMVLPSTGIRGRGEDFDTIADIRRGQRVRVFMSLRDGVYFAQIIQLLSER